MGQPPDSIAEIGEHLLDPSGPGIGADLLLVVEPLIVTHCAADAVARFARRFRASVTVAGFVERSIRLDEVALERIRLIREGAAWLGERLRLEGVQVATTRIVVHLPGEGPEMAAQLVDLLDPEVIAIVPRRRSRLLVFPGSSIAHHLERVATRPVIFFANRPDRPADPGHPARDDRPNLEIFH
ncbi:MAG: hypothetical protein ACREQM_19495 [Candidatus Dormibacteraceae bacterium]